MSRSITRDGWRAFVAHGTRTGKLATVRRDGRPHVVPVWFVLDGDDLVFTTGAGSRAGPLTDLRFVGALLRRTDGGVHWDEVAHPAAH